MDASSEANTNRDMRYAPLKKDRDVHLTDNQNYKSATCLPYRMVSTRTSVTQRIQMRNKLAALAAVGGFCLSAIAQQHRAPAVPLVTNDPFFSLWSMADKLPDAPVKHWTEVAQPILGLIRIDGKAYRWMGVMPRGYFGMPQVDAMEQ